MDAFIDYINNLYSGMDKGAKSIVLDPEQFVEKNFINQLGELGKQVFQQTASNNGIEDADIRIAFIKDYSMNAFAAYFGNTPFVCVNIGCIMNLLHYSSLLTIHSGFFPEIGDISNCTADVSADDYYFPEITEDNIGIYELCFYASADDKERQSLALLIALLAHAFLLFHELGHHIYGHTKLLSKVYGVSRLKAQENKELEQLGQVNCITIQCMETHADAYAMKKLTLMLINAPDMILDPSFTIHSQDDKFKVVFEMIITSVSLAFLLMDDDGIDEINFKNVYYLPKRLRIDLVLRTLRSIINENKDNEFAQYCLGIEDFSDTVANIYTNLRKKLYCVMERQDFNQDEKLLFSDSIENYYRNEILMNWEKLKLELASYAISKEV